ncbi:MAG: sigma-70 family RNA polymerase sigma factor [Clostridia bacterium]|nr:sigma-70 family RNA polymerase sigma factor [Clostridia bacterium]
MINKKEKELNQLFIEIRNTSNNEKFEELYNKYKALVYKIAYYILKNKEDSEDIVQTVFSKIYSMPRENLPNKNAYSWIYSVTKNESISLIRKRKNTISIEEIYNISETDGEINRVIDKEEFNRLISKLDNKEKEIVSLKILSDLSFGEISKLLNMSIGTVKWKYYKSIHTLKLLLSNLGMFIITFVVGIKTILVTKKNDNSNQINSTDKNEEENNLNVENSFLQDTTTQYLREEQNNINEEVQTNEEIKIPITETENNINYYGVGILTISGVFFVITIVFFINFIKHQLKRKGNTSK